MGFFSNSNLTYSMLLKRVTCFYEESKKKNEERSKDKRSNYSNEQEKLLILANACAALLQSDQPPSEKIATYVMQAEIYTRQSLLTLQQECTSGSGEVALAAYQAAIIACEHGQACLTEAEDRGDFIDKNLLAGSNTERLSDPTEAKERIKALIYEKLREFLNQIDQGRNYQIVSR